MRPLNTVQSVAPAIEPVTLTEAKLFLRVDSTGFAGDVTVAQSIAPGAHIAAAAYSLKGSGVAVLGAAEVIAVLEVGTVGGGGTIDVKLQEAAADVDNQYTDVASGAFAQVTVTGTTATLAYTGTKAYIRAVSTVAVATSSFGVNVTYRAGTSPEDSLITALITVARQKVETDTGRALITQTWDAYMEYLPMSYDYEIPMAQALTIAQQIRRWEIILPHPPLQSVSFIKYLDMNGAQQTLDPAAYQVDINADFGAVRPAYNQFWPFTRVQYNSVQIEFVCGYGAAASSVPETLKLAMKMLIGHFYDNREPVITGRSISAIEVPYGYDALINQYRTLNIT